MIGNPVYTEWYFTLRIVDIIFYSLQFDYEN